MVKVSIKICPSITLKNAYNKRFKTDSQRSAVLVRFGFCVYGAIIECCGSVAHHLSGRYASGGRIG